MRPTAPTFHSRLRSAAVAARVGTWLGVCFSVAFATGLISHYAQDGHQPIPFPTAPSWGYRVTQGLHVTSGTMAVPLLLVKLWAVYPRLFELRLPAGRSRAELAALGRHVVEKTSIGILVAAAIFQLATGLANTAQWYPWPFSFRHVHYAVAWLAIGALIVHIGVKLPVISGALTRSVEDTRFDRPEATQPGAVSRRALLRTTWLAAGGAALLTAGAAVPALRKVSLFAVRSGDGPQGIPVNRSARAAGVSADDVGPAYRLSVVHGERTLTLTLADLQALRQHTRDLPIACVEGWSASGRWTGVALRDLLAQVGAPEGADVRVVSLQRRGGWASSVLPANFAAHPDTLLALGLDGDQLDLDHGYPARLIAPNRPGVLQTKWVTRIEVRA